LGAARLLIDERLDASHNRRSKRGAPRAGPGTRIRAASRSAIRGIRPAKHVEVAPQAVCGEEGDVWSVAYGIVGVAEDGLPRRLGPALAGAADYTTSSGRAAGALARTAAARYCGHEK